MGGGMPYMLEKGPYFSITESVLEDVTERIALLVRLRSGEGFDTMPSLDAASLDAGPWASFLNRLAHQNQDWYGMRPGPPRADGTPTWQSQPPFNILTNRTTGYWYSWYGDALSIVKEAFTRAIEVSLGIPHDDAQKDPSAIAQASKQSWPIEVFWRCPAPWFESWITWRGDGPASTSARAGHVIVHIHTPSHHGSALLLSPLRSAPYNERESYGEWTKPPTPGARPLDAPPYSSRGMWVVAQREQVEYLNVVSAVEPTGAGRWRYPSIGPTVHSTGDVVVVQPNEPDGGVLADGRQYA
jgi:hypothetical protein